MRVLTILLLLLANGAVSLEEGALQARERRPPCQADSWAFSASREWVIYTCEVGGAGVVDDFSLDTEVFVVPTEAGAGEPLSIAARDWSAPPEDDVLWYLDDAGLVRRLRLSPVELERSGESRLLPARALSPLEPVRVFGLSAAEAVVEVEDPEGGCGICVVRTGARRLEVQECRASTGESCWVGGVPVSADALAAERRLGKGLYGLEYWTIDPLVRRWVVELPAGIEPRGLLRGHEGEFLVVGCSGDPQQDRPFLAIFDPSGTMGVVETISDGCTFGLLNPCPAVVGGTWEGDQWRVWLEHGPRPEVERLQVDSAGARCFSPAEVDWDGGPEAADRRP